jgi:hypothetical protein
VSPWTWLFGVWMLGALAVAGGWMAAFWSARRLVGRAQDESDPAWLVLAERTRRRTGVPTSLRLLRSDRLDVPIAWGYGRGAVVLPLSANGWSDEQREAVLLHEMAHLRRRDAWTQVVAQAALVLYWFNPLAWRAYRAFLSTREQACDDAALVGGSRPSSYAAHLVGVARAIRQEPLALSAAQPMARPNALEGRVLSVLDADRRRGPIGRSRLVATVLVGLGVLLPLAAFQPVEQMPIAAPASPVPSSPGTDDEPLVIRGAEGEVGEAQERLQLALRQVEDVHRRVEAAHLRIGQAASPDALARARADLDAAQLDWVAVQDTLSAAQEAIQEAVLARMGVSPDDEVLRELEASVRAAVAEPRPAPQPRATPRPPLPPVTAAPPAVDWDAIDRAREAANRRSLE